MASKKCPHGKPRVLLDIQVCKLGTWNGPGPYALFINMGLGGGALCIAEGSKVRMNQLLKLCVEHLKFKWDPAHLVSQMVGSLIPEHDKPPKRP